MMNRLRIAGIGVFGLLAVLAPFAAAQEAVEDMTPAQRYFLRGTDLMSNRKLLDAVEQFQLAIDEDPDFTDAYRRLAYVYTEMAQSEDEYYQDALDTYEDLEALLPGDDVEVKKSKAFVQAAMGDVDDAIETYETILEITPEDCSIWMQIGEAQRTQALRAKADAGEETPAVQERFDQAVKAYTTVTELCPDDLAAYNSLGELHFNNQDFDQAAKVFADLLEKDPENVNIASKLGYLYKQAEDWANAEPIYKQLLDLAPDRIDDRAVYAKVLEEAGKCTESAEQYQMIIDQDTSKKSMYCNLAFLYVKCKEGQKVINTAMRAISENAPEQPCLNAAWGKGLEIRAVEMYRQGLYDNAITGYSEAKLKFQTVQGDSNFGDYATKQIDRLNKLIEQARLEKKKAEQGD